MIKYLFVGILATALLNGGEGRWDLYKTQALNHQNSLHGWCSPEKATKMMELIYDTKPSVCVEIGVFGGSSIYPTAKALKYCRKGVVYAIDPWTHEDCQEGYDPKDPNYIWWTNLDLEAIYNGFLFMLNSHNLQRFCVPMRMTSEEALNDFFDESIDILHIDGNHSAEVALFDAKMWLPKVKSGGYIWFDDVNWSSTGKAVSYLKKYCVVDHNRSVGQECLLLRKN